MKISSSRTLLPLQLIVATCVLSWVAVAPPAQGTMLLVPIMPGSGKNLAADATNRGARLVANGPVRGSIVVSGDRDVIADGLLARGVLVLSAPEFLCGDSLGRPD